MTKEKKTAESLFLYPLKRVYQVSDDSHLFITQQLLWLW